MEQRHYGEIAKWLERLALVVFTSMVLQRMVLETSPSDPLVVLGIGATVLFYFLAIRLLAKS